MPDIRLSCGWREFIVLLFGMRMGDCLICLASLPKFGERTSIWEERCVLNDFLPRPNLSGCSPLSLSELIFGIPLRSDVAEDIKNPVTFGCSLTLCWDCPRVLST